MTFLKRKQLTGIAFFLLLILFIVGCSQPQKQKRHLIQFIYTSDSHFGITRAFFQGDTNVYSNVVNAAMVKKMNSLPGLTLPNDSGVNAGNPVGEIDYLINTGDIANRSEPGIQTASVSWNQFITTYVNGLTTRNLEDQRSKIWLIAGNHDVSNAIGHYRIPSAQTDNASMVGIYNYMFPEHPLTSASFSYSKDKIHYSKDVDGIHFLFLNMWPDSTERIWMKQNLKTVSDSTPVLIFTHDEPNVEAKHFSNPNGKHNINATDKFENLLGEFFKDGNNISFPSTIEQRGFVSFLKKHKNIKVYFHGNDNENRYYDYHGPDNDIDLKVIQVDSPMKGDISRHDETKLSFQLVSIDPDQKRLTVRECLWNSDPGHPEKSIVWGAKTTIQL